MLSVRGIFDGKAVKLLDEVKIDEPRKVIVTFLEDTDEEIHKEIYAASGKSGTFDFLKEPSEDIYTDNDLKIKYKK